MIDNITITGRIIKGIAGFYYVFTESGIYECKAKGLFRKEGKKPFVGDYVEIAIIDEENKLGNINEIRERKNSVIRPASANIDMAVIVMSLSKPAIKYRLLDKIILFFEYNDIDIKLLFNKVDEASSNDIENVKEQYSESGYEMLFVSAKTGEGIDELRHLLKDKTSILTGPSGVGKSSIINDICPDALMETGDISKIGRGRHTTRHSEIFIVDKDTFILDTPGFTSMDLPDIDKKRLRYFYPEFRGYEGGCKFDGCVHIKEPGCKVLDALEKGKIHIGRYEGYVDFYEELSRRNKY